MNNAPAILFGAISWTAALGSLAILASMATLARLFQIHIDGRPLLTYELRRPVPWNALAPALVLAPTALAILLTASPSEPTSSPSPLDEITAKDIWAQAGAYFLLAGVCQVMLAAAFGATAIDLGLPQSWRQLRRDAKIGAIAFLAMLLPVYGIQTILTIVLEPEQMHPLIEQLETHYSPEMIVAAVAAVVLAAPLFEETTFRLIFQGWLEQREDISLGWRKRVEGPDVGPIGALPATDESPTDVTESPPMVVEAEPLPPAMGLLPGLPYGWAPVLVSGAVFAMAHLGHGVAPVSLFPLGVTLGYIYQRTHRITPSLVCHGLFNGFSILMLWLELASSPGTPAQ